jgi:hypothetical protein
MFPVLVPGSRVCRDFIRFASFRRAYAPKRKPDCVLPHLLTVEQASQPTSFATLVNSEMSRNSHLHTGYRHYITTSTHGASSRNVDDVAINIVQHSYHFLLPYCITKKYTWGAIGGVGQKRRSCGHQQEVHVTPDGLLIWAHARPGICGEACHTSTRSHVLRSREKAMGVNI